jgi:hypothetical protein
MPDQKQGSIHSATDGGVIGKHPGPDPSQFLVAPSTSNELNTARLRLIPIACFRIDDVRFKFDSSFVLPDVKIDMDAFSQLRKLDPRVTDAPISIFGHADPSYQGNFEPGSATAQSGDDYNKTLSGRRAIAIYSLLIRDPSYWSTLYTNHLGGDVWGEDAIRIMLDQTDPPTSGGGQSSQSQNSTSGASSQNSSESARNSRVRDIANDSGQRQQLFFKYMNVLCGDLKLDKSADFLARGSGSDLKGDVQGCGRFNPMLLFSSEDEALYKQAFADKDESTLRGERDPSNGPNRRVMILIFQKGSQILPAKWPCPTYKEGTAGCKKRFWSDSDTRRSTRNSGEERNFEDTQDTFACRFYQRISSQSPCNTIMINFQIQEIRLHDAFGQLMPGVDYEMTFSGTTVRNQTDDEGLVVEPLAGITGRCIIKWDPQDHGNDGSAGFAYQLDLFLSLADLTSDFSIQRALHNLGFTIDLDFQENLRHFQALHDLEITGKNDDATQMKIQEIFISNSARDSSFELDQAASTQISPDEQRT